MTRRMAIIVALLPLIGATVSLTPYVTAQRRKFLAGQEAIEMPEMSEIPETYETSEAEDRNTWACWAARKFVQQAIDDIASRAHTRADVSFETFSHALETNGQWRVQGEVTVLLEDGPGEPMKLRWEATLAEANGRSPIHDNAKMISFFEQVLLKRPRKPVVNRS